MATSRDRSDQGARTARARALARPDVGSRVGRTAKTDHTLDGIRVMAELTPAMRRDLEARCVWQHYQAGDTIVTQGDTTLGIYFLVHGRARVSVYAASGRAVTFRDIPTGDVFGELAAIDGLPRVASVEAVDACTIGLLPLKALQVMLDDNPRFARALLLHMAGLVRALTVRVFEFSTLAVENRVNAELLRLARMGRARNGEMLIDPAPTHADIASRVSTTREGVTRIVKRLAELGVVEKRGGTLVVKDLRQLEVLVAQAGDMPITTAPAKWR
jgi:CRP/FNR family transcriptional regulator, cyclic AMP receptor protein